MPIEAGQQLLHYRLVEKIGEGGMGVVWKADDTILGRRVAIKILPAAAADDVERVARFRREARLLASLNHPNIAAIHGLEETKDARFLVLELVEGRTLREVIGGRPMAIPDVLRIALELAEGLAAAHGAHVIHRDLKPDNLIVTTDGHVKILDFGLATVLDDPRRPGDKTATTLTAPVTEAGAILGTVAYMSPEQVRGGPLDERTDQFSFGAILYEMLTGRRAFQGNSTVSIMAAVLGVNPAPVRQIRRDVPKALADVVARCLAKPADRRYSTSAGIVRELKAIQSTLAVEVPRSPYGRWLRRPSVSIPVSLAVVVMIAAGATAYHRYSKVKWARYEEIPALEQRLQEGFSEHEYKAGVFTDIFRRVQEVRKYAPDDPRIPALLSRCSNVITVDTDPQGADVYVRDYFHPHDDWRLLGRTPLQEIRVPLAVYRWRFEKDGHETVEAGTMTFATSDPPDPPPDQRIERTLDPIGARPPGMVRVAGYEYESVGYVDAFFIDRLEVSNRQYKQFVDAGGYRNPDYWQHAFVKNGSSLSREKALAEFLDDTGRPGPSTWQAGDYPEGEEEYPVSGVSWYEAAAYAAFRNKSLPTVWHWRAATGDPWGFNGSKFMVGLSLASNVGGAGPAPVGSHPGMDGFGAMDMAGNVREWNFNETAGGRYVAGGAWDDASYMYLSESQRSPWDRSPGNGFRCARYIDAANIPREVFEPYDFTPTRDYRTATPVADPIFEVYKAQFGYDPTDLKATVEERDESSEDWVREKVTFDAAYPGERVVAHLFLPKNATPPFQTVIYFPGSMAVLTKEPLGSALREYKGNASFMVKNGRAVMYPVYAGTYERSVDQIGRIHWPVEGFEHAHREFLIKWVKDFSRSVDYLATRVDIDSDRLAYYGASWGGTVGLVITAVEPRLKASILHLGGFGASNPLPEVHGLNYVSRITLPTLMLNGRYDSKFPLETDVEVVHRLMATPEADKRLVVYGFDHFIPRKDKIRETLGWLDRYLGTVE